MSGNKHAEGQVAPHGVSLLIQRAARDAPSVRTQERCVDTTRDVTVRRANAERAVVALLATRKVKGQEVGRAGMTFSRTVMDRRGVREHRSNRDRHRARAMAVAAHEGEEGAGTGAGEGFVEVGSAAPSVSGAMVSTRVGSGACSSGLSGFARQIKRKAEEDAGAASSREDRMWERFDRELEGIDAPE